MQHETELLNRAWTTGFFSSTFTAHSAFSSVMHTSLRVVALCLLLACGTPRAQAQPALPHPDSAWTTRDLMPHLMRLRPNLAVGEAATPAQSRVVRPGLFAHMPPIREAIGPEGTWLAGTEDGHIYIRRAGQDSTAVLAMTDDEGRWDVEGARWAPDARWIAVRRIHDADVPRIPIVDWATDTVRPVPYSRAGEPLPTHRLGVVHRTTGETRMIPHSPGTVYVHAVGWSPGSTRLRYLEADRLITRLDLMEFDVASGTTRRLIRETSDTNVLGLNMLHGYADRLDRRGLVHFFDERNAFVWASERSGSRHLYLYGLDGTLRRSLTEGALSGPVDRVVHVDRARGAVFVVAQGDPSEPHRQQLYRVGLDAGDVRLISEGPVITTVRPVPDTDDLWVYRAGLPDIFQVDRVTRDGEVVETVWEADWTPLQAYMQSVQRLTLPAADGETQLDALLVMPSDFDSSRSYPLVEFIYAGPNENIVPREPVSPWLWDAYALANRDYVVVMVDGRGTPGRGKAFRDATHGRIGQIEIADHRAAIEQLLADHTFIDPERIGILGHSWGGYFALRAMTQAPDLYRAAVLAAPAVDLGDFRVAIEPYMGCLPTDCPEAYAAGANTTALDRLGGPLLIIHGTADDDVPLSESLKLVSALEAAQKPYDLRILPGIHHIVQQAPAYTRHVPRFFDQSLSLQGIRSE